MVTLLVAVPPALVAVQDSAVPAVGEAITVWPQPAVELIGDSASCTSQLTVTGPVYQPLAPSGPPCVSRGVNGGVVSTGVGWNGVPLSRAAATLPLGSMACTK